jgi:hypothetical protein
MELPTMRVVVYRDADLDNVNRMRYEDVDETTKLGWRWEVTVLLPHDYDPMDGDVLRADAKLVAMRNRVDDEYYTQVRFDNSEDTYMQPVPDDIATRARERAQVVMIRGSQ